MNWKVTYARPRKSTLRVWIEAETREEADRKSLEFEEVKCFLSEDGIYNKSIINEDTIIQERQTIYAKTIKTKGIEMRKFDVVFFDKKRNKNLVYKDLAGQKAIDLMANLIKKGFEPYARTESFRAEEILTFEEMKEAVI